MDIRHEPPSGWTSNDNFEFDITCNEIREGLVDFEADMLTFCFTPRTGTGELECKVELREYLGGGSIGSVLLNGTGVTTIHKDQTANSWLCFSGFGWHDEKRTQRIGVCHYRVSLEEGTSTVRVVIGAQEHQM
ncbi:hypothetical protein ACIQMR_37620 [Streptomyces sp. NPDC091376]|uniref:hypothetical protein n=1 Tax=Streptomyces sp. NPDC091376 TaxID=3365994 RepID=UPI0037F8B918